MVASSKRIGFIGTGVMGRSMAANLLQAGFKLAVYNRTKEKAEELVAQGATWKESPADVAASSDIVITIVGYPRDVADVYLGEQGIVRHAHRGTTVIDMTTSKPSLAKRIAEEAGRHGIYALDAPVSGGDIGAREGTLSIMVGGERAAFDAVKHVLEVMGTGVVYQGPAGAGQHTKMCNQIAIAANMMGVCEAVAYAERAGLDPATVLSSIASGAAGSWSLSNLAPRMLAGDFAPGFFIKHFIKDMQIALESAEEIGLKTPALALAKSLYDQLATAGEEDSGTQALIKWYLHSLG